MCPEHGAVQAAGELCVQGVRINFKCFGGKRSDNDIVRSPADQCNDQNNACNFGCAQFFLLVEEVVEADGAV